jgi:hypothetical protein
LKEIVSGNKGRYNKFSNIAKSKPSLKETYADIMKSKDFAKLDQFLDDVVSTKGNLPADTFNRYRGIIKETGETNTAEWMPWVEITGKYGDDNVLEMIQAGTLEAKKNPNLPANSKIAYPRNQLVRYCRTVATNTETQRDEGQLAEHQAVEPEGHEQFLKDFAEASIESKSENKVVLGYSIFLFSCSFWVIWS